MDLLIECLRAYNKWLEGLIWWNTHWYFKKEPEVKRDPEAFDKFLRRIQGIPEPENGDVVSKYGCF